MHKFLYVSAVSWLALAASSAAAQSTGSTTGSTQEGTPAGVTSATVPTPAASPQTTAPAPDQDGLGDIIVTANKRSESANRVPMSITALSGDQLSNAGISSAADLAKVVPGFIYNEATYSAPVYSIRGVGFFESTLSARPTVSVYVDEVAIPFPALTRGASLDLERVEVLKGPQGILFGQNSTGGAVNYIAAKPTTSFKAGLDLSYGRFNEVEANGFISGPITDGIGARLSLKHIRSDDWQYSTTRNDTLGGTNQTIGRFQLEADASDRLHFRLMVNGFIDKSDVQAAQFVGLVPGLPAAVPLLPLLTTLTPAPNNSRAADWDPNTQFKRDNWYIQPSFRIDYDLSNDITFTSITSYNRYRARQGQDADGTNLPNLAYFTRADDKSFSQELRVAGSIGDRLKFIVGGNYSNDDVVETRDGNISYLTNSFPFFFAGTGPQFPFYREQTSQKTKTYAGFGNIDYDIGSLITLHAGARYTKYTINFTGCTGDSGDGNLAAGIGNLFNFIRSQIGLPPNPAIARGACVTGSVLDPANPANFLVPGLFISRLSENGVSWRGGIDIKPAPGVLLYANVSKGFKGGSYPQLSASSASQYAPARQESLIAYEAGFKLSVLERHAQINGAVFYYDYSNKQIRGRVVATPNIFGPLEALVNVPKSSITGGELQIILSPVRDFTVNLGATYIDSKIKGGFTNFDAFGNTYNFNGEPFPYAPRWQLQAAVDYKFPVSSGLDAFFGANLSHQSDSFGGFGQTVSPLTQRYLKIPAYVLADARIGVETPDGKWRLSGWVKNIFNEFYLTNAAFTSDTAIRTTGRPITYGTSVSLRF